MSREYAPQARLAVSAVIFHEGRVLLVRRAKEPGKGLYSLPGGGLRLGETLAEAVCREVKEETGLVVSAGPLVTTTERILRDEEGSIRFHYVILTYVAHYQGGTAAASGDADEVFWATPKQANLTCTEGLWEAIVKASASLDLRGE
jgi:8-oxo-dGTP diphosphatase